MACLIAIWAPCRLEVSCFGRFLRLIPSSDIPPDMVIDNALLTVSVGLFI